MKIVYQDRIVAFIDVLGFSSLVYSKSIEPIQNYFNYVLEEFTEDLRYYQFQYYLISDSIVVHLPIDKMHFEALVRTLVKLQMKLITRGILVRGSISFGELFSDNANNIIVGAGLINAFKLEAKAIYPRIIIDRKIIPLLYENSVAMLEDNSGRIVITPPPPYLTDFPYLNYTYKLAIVMQGQKLHRVKELLRQNNYLNDNIDKYLWLVHHILLSVQNQMTYLESKPAKNKRDARRMRILTKFKSEIEAI
ncbi:MAG TPA: hypothetical protein VEY11_05125 [Pyrinomonadaceae bacterium]|nr:hypothetical protein [Pyrinomonadaceae bacterium]